MYTREKIIVILAMIGIIVWRVLRIHFMPYWEFKARKSELETSTPIIIGIAVTIAIQMVLQL